MSSSFDFQMSSVVPTKIFGTTAYFLGNKITELKNAVIVKPSITPQECYDEMFQNDKNFFSLHTLKTQKIFNKLYYLSYSVYCDENKLLKLNFEDFCESCLDTVSKWKEFVITAIAFASNCNKSGYLGECARQKLSLEFNLTFDEINILCNFANLIIDMQNDFCDTYDGAGLSVPNMTNAANVINELLDSTKFQTIFTCDVHVIESQTFYKTFDPSVCGVPCVPVVVCYNYGTENAVYRDEFLWNEHCVASTQSQKIFNGLKIPEDSLIIEKGHTIESYSSLFDQSGKPGSLYKYLLGNENITGFIVAGVAEGGFCVTTHIKHLRALGYPVIEIVDGTSAIDLGNGNIEACANELESLGVIRINLSDFLEKLNMIN